MKDVRVLDLDGSLRRRAALFSGAGHDLAPRTRVGARSSGWLARSGPIPPFAAGWATRLRMPARASPSMAPETSITSPWPSWSRSAGPFNLLVLDKHPDWMRGIPFLHCGTWLRHRAEASAALNRVSIAGAISISTMLIAGSPRGPTSSGRVVVFPARRRFARGRWAGVATHPLADPGPAARGCPAHRPASLPRRSRPPPALYLGGQGRADRRRRGGELGLGAAPAAAGPDGPRDVSRRRADGSPAARCSRRLVAREACSHAEPAVRLARPSQSAARRGRSRRPQPACECPVPPGPMQTARCDPDPLAWGPKWSKVPCKRHPESTLPPGAIPCTDSPCSTGIPRTQRSSTATITRSTYRLARAMKGLKGWTIGKCESAIEGEHAAVLPDRRTLRRDPCGPRSHPGFARGESRRRRRAALRHRRPCFMFDDEVVLFLQAGMTRESRESGRAP